MTDATVIQGPAPAGDGKGSPGIGKIGLAAATAGTGGFAFGLFGQLGIAQMIQDHTFYSFAVLGFVAALILATGRASLPMDKDSKTFMDRMVIFSATTCAICLVVVFLQPQQVKVYARFVPNIGSVAYSPKLFPKLLNADGSEQDLVSKSVPINVVNGGRLEIDIDGLVPLLTLYGQTLGDKKQATTNQSTLITVNAPPPPSPPA